VEHLQSAAREMISAARAVLDVLEDLVEDPDRVRDVVDSAGSAVGEVISLSKRRPRPSNPWFDEAWKPGESGHDGPSSPTVADSDPHGFERIDLG